MPPYSTTEITIPPSRHSYGHPSDNLEPPLPSHPQTRTLRRRGRWNHRRLPALRLRHSRRVRPRREAVPVRAAGSTGGRYAGPARYIPANLEHRWTCTTKFGRCRSGPACTCTRTPRARSSTSARRRTCAAGCAATLWRAAAEDAKTGSLLREAVDVDYIVVDNEKEALALENNLIKQKKPRFNILLRDDKTYPYVKLTLGERFPRVYVTRRLRKDGSAYYGPYFPANLAYRIVDLIHRHFLIPSCKVDLTPVSPAAVPAVLHRALPGSVRAGADHARRLRGSGARREAVPGRPADGALALAAPAHGSRRGKPAVRAGGQVSRPDLDRRAAAGQAAHGGRRGRRRRRVRLPLGKPDAGRQPVPHARRQGAGPARIFLGRPAGHAGAEVRPERASYIGGYRRPGEFPASSSPRCSSRSTSTSNTCRGTIFVPVEFEDRESAGRAALRQLRPPRADRGAAARREALADRPGRAEREAVVRPALPGDEAGGQGDPGSRCRTRSRCPSCRGASSASTSRTSRARRRWRRWWCGKTAR